jgi:hypothetical protein
VFKAENSLSTVGVGTVWYHTIPDVVLLAQFRDNRREMGCEIVANQHLDVILGELLDVAEEDLTRNNF